jgi:DNA-binding PadR family transcriptional regulator
MQKQINLFSGISELRLMQLLSTGPLSAHQLEEAIQHAVRCTSCVSTESLYLALHQLQSRNWIEADWSSSSRMYSLSPIGLRHLKIESEDMDRYSRVLHCE